ncbi:MAG: helix-turn-helix transcriptional regulator [Flavobacterium sp.]|nr:helix-turn-helix transcriptional regulator [Flavobacterium sp.]
MKTTINYELKSLGTLSSSHSCLNINDYVAIETGKQLEPRSGFFYNETNKLLCITQGRLLIKHGNQEFIIGENEMAILRKDILVEYQIIYETDYPLPVEYFFFSFKDDVVKEFTKLTVLSTLENKIHPSISIKSFGRKLLSYIGSLEPYFIEPDTAEMSLVKIKLFELLFYLSISEHEIFNMLLDLKISYKSGIVSAVEENIMNSISIEQIAVLAGKSLSSFRREFFSIYNMPPSQWIRQKRLEKAQEFLLSTSMSVTDVCYTLGFENVAHFSRLFKSQFGQSPIRYRMNKRAS